MARPSATEYSPSHDQYINLIPESEIVPVLESQRREVADFLQKVPETVGNVRHPPYTWSVKEVVGHLTDAERILGYRALRFARNDLKPLQGFDQDPYVLTAQFNRLPLRDLAAEFDAIRRSNVYLFKGMAEDAWNRVGVASDNPISVRALAYVIAGHVRHHLAILRKRLAGDKPVHPTV